MTETTVRGKWLKWGHSYGIRVRRKDARRIAANPGDEVTVRLETRTSGIDVAKFHVFRGPDSRGSREHDRLLAEGATPKKRRGRA